MSERPDLTVCCSVNTPPGRVAAAFAPLAGLAAQIVLAVDDRVDPAWIDGYRRIADRVLLVPFPGNFGRMYAWLRTHCDGRWILQLDHDEVPSASLVDAVAELIATDDVTHAWVPRRWLFGDGARWLAQWPWQPDYALRLLRNDPALLRFPGLLHCTVRVLGPCRYLRAPLYHADLVLSDVALRERKQREYEREMPGFVVDGTSLNEVYYLPERLPGLRLRDVAPEDTDAVAAFLAAGVELAPAPQRRRLATLRPAGAAEIAGLNERRPLAEDAYDARLQLLDDDPRLVCAEWRTFDVEVGNRGTTTWPGGMDADPQIRLGYRWLADDGSVLEEGGRTGLPAPLRPGAKAVVPLEVLGPPEAAAWTIEIDLVHEHVRWFGAGIRVPLEVRAPSGSARATRTSAL